MGEAMGAVGTPLALSLAGLVVIAVTVLAFREPAVYARLFPYLIAAVAATYLACYIWDCALLQGENAVISALGGLQEARSKVDIILAASGALHARQVPVGLMSVTLVCTTAYLALLRLVPVARDAAKSRP
jgi:hypothetical protein